MEEQIILSENSFIKKEVMDTDPLALDGDDMIENKMICDRNMLRYINEGRDLIKQEVWGGMMTESNDHDILMNNVNHIEETPGNEHLIKEELIIANGKIIKVEELIGITDMKGKAMSHNQSCNKKFLNTCEMTGATDLLKISPNCSENSERGVPGCDVCPGSFLKSFVCIECHTSFLYCVSSPNQEKPLACEKCHKSKLETCQQVLRREKFSVNIGTDAVPPDEIPGINAALQTPKEAKPISENLVSHQQQDREKRSQLCLDGKGSACNECNKVFSTSALKRHNSGEKPNECNECNKVFSSTTALKRHLKIHTGEKPFKCKECNKMFSHKSDVKVHLRLHTGEKPYKCNECNKMFTQKSQLKVHLVVHTDEKPFECKECNKRFSRKTELKVHLQVHNGEEPFPCNDCNKVFFRKSNLNQHLRVHTGEKPYECSECNKWFTQTSSLRKHLRIHTGEKPFKCNECNKMFTQKCQLQAHVQVHSGRKAYECNKCNKAFSQKLRLSEHLKLHSGGKPFECAECDEVFSRRSEFRRHSLLHTSKEPFEFAECNNLECTEVLLMKSSHINLI